MKEYRYVKKGDVVILRIDEAMKRRARRYANLERRSLGSFIRNALEDRMDDMDCGKIPINRRTDER